MELEQTKWTIDDFQRRYYRYDQDNGELDRARHIVFLVKVDGKTLIEMQLREPGLVALISRPDDDGFLIEVVEPGGRRFVDVARPGSTDTEVLGWQQLLLFGDPE